MNFVIFFSPSVQYFSKTGWKYGKGNKVKHGLVFVFSVFVPLWVKKTQIFKGCCNLKCADPNTMLNLVHHANPLKKLVINLM